MNILFVVEALNIGGAQTFMLRLANKLSLNHKVVILDLTPDLINTQLVENLLFNKKVIVESYHTNNPVMLPKILNILIHYIDLMVNKFGNINFREHLTLYLINRRHKKRFNEIVDRNKITHISSHLFKADDFVCHVNSRHIPWYISMHGCYEALLHGGYDNSSMDPIDIDFIPKAKAVLEACTGIIIAAEKNKEIFGSMAGFNMHKINKIYYGYEASIYDIITRKDIGVELNDFVLGIVARGSENKGWEIAIDALNQIMMQGYDKVKLIFIYSDSEYMEELKQNNSNKNVLFLGSKSNPLPYIYMFDVGILPTYFASESLPNTVIEYLFCEKPVIATVLGDIPLMLQTDDGEIAGCLLNLDQNKMPSVESLVNQIVEYIKMPLLLQKHRRLASKAFVKFDMNTCTVSYLKLFDSVDLSFKNEKVA